MGERSRLGSQDIKKIPHPSNVNSMRPRLVVAEDTESQGQALNFIRGLCFTE